MKKYKKSLKTTKIVIVLLLLLLFSFLYFYFVSYPLICTLCEDEVKQVTLVAICNAEEKIRKIQPFYGNFYTYSTNQSGDVVLASANTSAINELIIVAKNEILKELLIINSQTIDIPLGSLLGSSLFADLGNNISFKVKEVTLMDTDLFSSYVTEGINQTLHSLTLRVRCSIDILLPLKAKTVIVDSDILLCEDIIVGNVPDSYITDINEDNIFDLFP